MPVERSYRRFTPYALAVEPQLLRSIHRAGLELGLELGVLPQHHWLAEEFLCAPLPEDMAVVKGATLEDTYYYNTKTMETVWVHPSTDAFRELAKIVVDNSFDSVDSVAVAASLGASASNGGEQTFVEQAVSEVLKALPEYPHLEGVQLVTPDLLIHVAKREFNVDISRKTPRESRDLWAVPLLLEYIKDLHSAILPENWAPYDDGTGTRVFFNVETQETRRANPWTEVHHERIVAARQSEANGESPTVQGDWKTDLGLRWVAFGDGNRQVYYHNFATHATSHVAPALFESTTSAQRAIRRFLAPRRAQKLRERKQRQEAMVAEARQHAEAAMKVSERRSILCSARCVFCETDLCEVNSSCFSKPPTGWGLERIPAS